MALYLKSNKSFKILAGVSALSISAMAATFSVTGIATLFSGYFLTVAIMMGVLEFGKIVVASFLARFWEDLSKILKSYFMAALFILILITSGGIFGYLSDAYQKTKGDYTVTEKQVSLIDTKVKLFQSEKDRYQNRIDALNTSRIGQESRLDFLYSRGQTASARRVESLIASSDKELADLTKKLSAVNDSIGAYETTKVEKESVNITGELGPLKYIAGIFDTDMDTVVKYFIFMLIFVFDPLAVLLFVSLNIIIKKEGGLIEEPKEEIDEESLLTEEDKQQLRELDKYKNGEKSTFDSVPANKEIPTAYYDDEFYSENDDADIIVSKKDTLADELMKEYEKSISKDSSKNLFTEDEIKSVDNEIVEENKIENEKNKNVESIVKHSANYHP